jgi:hypothetical protein
MTPLPKFKSVSFAMNDIVAEVGGYCIGGFLPSSDDESSWRTFLVASGADLSLAERSCHTRPLSHAPLPWGVLLGVLLGPDGDLGD